MEETIRKMNGNGRCRAQSSRPSFSLGRVLATPGSLEALDPEEIRAGLARHAGCDWGELSEEDKRANDYAVNRRLRILSAYRVGSLKYWIITEADRSATTVLLPEEY